MRLPPDDVRTIRYSTAAVRRDCDTFYAAPGYDSLYLYTGLPAPTGFLAILPGALDTEEQQKLARQLADLDVVNGVRVLRDQSRATYWSYNYGNGPLAQALAGYETQFKLAVEHFRHGGTVPPA